jgi:hypothetical protein
MVSRTTDDYERMRAAGIVGVVEPAFWQGQPRTHIGTFLDYFSTLIGWERFRAGQFGIRHYCTIGLNPKEANDVPLAEEVMRALPRFLQKDGVVAIGEIGYDEQSDPEERFFAEQIELAKEYKLPVLIHTPHRDKKRGTERSIALVKETGIDEERVLIDHLTETTLPLVLDTGCWRGHSIYPNTKMSEERMVALLKQYGTEKMVVNSAADWGVSDPLKVPKTADAMRAAGFSETDIERVLFINPIDFYAQSGRIAHADFGAAKIDQRLLYQDNSVLRGQTPVVQE